MKLASRVIRSALVGAGVGIILLLLMEWQQLALDWRMAVAGVFLLAIVLVARHRGLGRGDEDGGIR